MKELIDFNSIYIQSTLKILLQDKTTKKNIIWATGNYEHFGEGYGEKDEITIERLNSLPKESIQPRVLKSRSVQKGRTKKRGEVFTPSWVCALMNNYCDDDWFERKNAFNFLKDHEWKGRQGKIYFPKNIKNRKWTDYIDARKIEITCGEAPYIVSRYDTTTGEAIGIPKRIGFLDRKLRVVGERTSEEEQWTKWTIRAYKSSYGYEFQGDNLLIARINLLLTFVEYFKYKWNKEPDKKTLLYIANIIAWNVWQMDGLTSKTPFREDFCRTKNWRNGSYGTTTYFKYMEKEKEHMPKFDFCIGNPPFQGNNHQQLYPLFYNAAKEIANVIDMIFPTGWQEPKDANNLGRMNNSETKEDRQIVLIDNRVGLFPGIQGADLTNIVIWKRGYDNGLNGKQKLLIDGRNPEIKKLLISKDEITKPNEIIELSEIVAGTDEFQSLVSNISVRKPYGLSTDILDSPDKYQLPEIYETRRHDDDIAIYGLKNKRFSKRYIPKDYPLPKVTPCIDKYTVLIGKAWGGFQDNYLGGTYSKIIIAGPSEICSENYLESGCFDDFETAQKHAKYLMTQFCRALLFRNKHTRDNSRDKWVSVPYQKYTEEWWEGTIEQIDEHLFDKYKIPQNIRDFVKANIQPKTTDDIVNFDKEGDI